MLYQTLTTHVQVRDRVQDLHSWGVLLAHEGLCTTNATTAASALVRGCMRMRSCDVGFVQCALASVDILASCDDLEAATARAACRLE